MSSLRAKALFACLALAAGLALVLGTAALGAPGKGGKDGPKVEKISLLYVVDAGKGSIRPSGKGTYKLTLGGLGRDLVWFSDRPARRSGTFPTRGIVDGWKGFGFLADPPNAALVYDERTAVVELGPPRAARGKLTFTIRPLGDRGAGRNLAAHAREAEPIKPGEFADAALFVDNAQGMTFKGCLFEPYTVCSGFMLETGSLPYFEGIDLRGAKFTEVEFGTSNFSHANLEGATLDKVEFEQANLTGANLKKVTQNEGLWQGVDLSGAEVQKADLSNAFLYQATANRTEFREADLSGAVLRSLVAEEADFRGADLREADFTGAKLWHSNFGYADVTGADFEGASFNETIMPNSWVCNNRNGAAGCLPPGD